MALDDAWMAEARCRDLTPEEMDRLFFPPKRKGVKADYKGAKALCEGCPVRVHCLHFAIAHSISEGVWGGLDPTERKQMDRELKIRYRKAWWRLHPLSRPKR